MDLREIFNNNKENNKFVLYCTNCKFEIKISKPSK
jgi:hypothetical protein